MMLKNNNQPDIKETLEPILRVLTQLGGKFSFTDDEGRQFVIMKQEDVKNSVTEKQLALPSVPDKITSADDVLEKINREIALWQMQDQEDMEEPDDSFSNEEEFHSSQEGVPTPPRINQKEEEVKRVRFEPIKGDLNPELQ